VGHAYQKSARAPKRQVRPGQRKMIVHAPAIGALPSAKRAYGAVISCMMSTASLSMKSRKRLSRQT
jgi:hypothetical protein